MKRSCKELKRMARANLDQKYKVPMKAYVYAALISALIELPFSLLQTEESFSPQNIILFIAQILISVVTIVLTCGEYRIHLKIARKEQANIKDLFYPIKNLPDRYILARLLFLGYLILAAIFLIPAIVSIYINNPILILISIPLGLISVVLILMVSFTFDLVFFFMLDNENLTVMEAFRICKQTMKGNKRRYFYITLSFIGMSFLIILSLGIGVLWVHPYINQTLTLFYLDITGQLDNMEESTNMA